MLLYARTTEEFIPNFDASIDGNRIMVRSLDLNQKFDQIRKQLDGIVESVFD